MTFSPRTARWTFYLGTLSSLVLFLILTVDTQRQTAALTHADKLDARVVEGKRVFQRYNCNDCHTILGFGGYYAPDLTRVYPRIGEPGIRNSVLHPDVVFAKSFRKMPVEHVKPEEVDALVAFFRWVGDIDNHGWPPQDEKFRKSQAKGLVASATLSPGAALVQEKGCLTCHSISGVGGDSGIPLDHIGSTLSAEKISAYIRDPQAINPKALMPAQDLTEGERAAVTEFLARQN